MAERRMFAKSIVQSGKFLRMSPSARLLYYDLGMSADDDGVVEAYTVMVLTKASEDDLRVLVAKGYVTILNDDLVSQIMDWKTNNFVRGDRYHESLYKNLLIQMENNKKQQFGIPDDNQRYTEVRLGKDRLGKVSSISAPTLEEVQAYCKERGKGVDAQKFYDYYSETGWKSSDGKPVKNWKGKMIAVWEGKVTTSLPKKQICNDANEMSTYASKNGGIDFDVL